MIHLDKVLRQILLRDVIAPWPQSTGTVVSNYVRFCPPNET
jgi:hypothetical protein